MNLKELHDVIASTLLSEITGLQSVLCTPSGREPLEAPAGFLEVSEIAVGADPGTGELSVILTFTLRILIDSTIPNANIVLQSLLIKAAQTVHLNNFGLAMTPGRDIEIQYETIQDADGLLAGSVSWRHELHAGESEWASIPWIPPHTIYLNSEVL